MFCRQTAEAQELPGFELTGEFSEKRVGSFHQWSNKGARLGSALVQLFYGGQSRKVTKG